MVRGYSEDQVEVGWMHYYIMWFTRGNKDVLEGNRLNRCKEIIEKEAQKMGCTIKDIKIDYNSVYLGLKATPILSPHQMISQLKGETSNALRKEFPNLRKMPSLWTRSYFVSTFSEGVPNDEINAYIKKVEQQIETQRLKRRVGYLKSPNPPPDLNQGIP